MEHQLAEDRDKSKGKGSYSDDEPEFNERQRKWLSGMIQTAVRYSLTPGLTMPPEDTNMLPHTQPPGEFLQSSGSTQ